MVLLVEFFCGIFLLKGLVYTIYLLFSLQLLRSIYYIDPCEIQRFSSEIKTGISPSDITLPITNVVTVENIIEHPTS